MKEITIDTLTLESFKGIDYKKLCFAGESRTLTMEKGRKTVFDAWCWVLFGKDSQGSTLTEFRTLGDRGKPADPLALTQVTVNLLENGGQREFRRTLRRTPEGTWTSDFYVDGIPCRKTGYQQKVEQLVKEPVFWLLTDLQLFTEKLSWQEKRDLLLHFTDLPGDRELLEKEYRFHQLADAMGQIRPGDFQKKLSSEKMDLMKAATDLPFRISELEAALRQLKQPDFDEIQKRRACLSREREKLLKGNNPREKRLQYLNAQIAQLDRTLGLQTVMESCGKRLLKLRKDQDRSLLRLRHIRQLLCLWDGFQETKGEMAEKSLRDRFPELGFHLVKVRENGRKEPGCELSFRGLPWRNLDSGEKLLCTARILSRFSKLYGISLPLFLTHSEGKTEDWERQVIALLPKGE